MTTYFSTLYPASGVSYVLYYTPSNYVLSIPDTSVSSITLEPGAGAVSYNGHNVALAISAAAFVNDQITIPVVPSQGSTIATASQTATSSPLTASSLGTSTPSTASTALTASAATTPPLHSNTPVKKSGVSSGGVAGISIGCAIAGAAIGFLLFWFFKRKSNNRHQTPDQEARAAALSRQEKQPVVNIQPLDNANLTTRTVENNLPQPLEDNAIAEAISKISNSIKNHVQSYYHSARVSTGAVNPDALQALGDGLPTSIGTLNTMLANPTTRETALRLCIAWIVVSRIQFGGDPRITFLPPEVISCINSMTGLDSKPQVRTAFLSKWRVLTAELMQTTYGSNAFPARDPRNHNILQAVEVLDAVLRPYTDERVDNNQRRRNLEEILKRAAGFAFMLFSQPSSWKLEWENPHGHEPGSIVIFPALVQIVDETGRSLSPPRAFSEVVVRQING